MQVMPHRIVADIEAPNAQLVRQRGNCQMQAGLQSGEEPCFLGGKNAGTLAAIGLAIALPEARRRCAHFTALATLTPNADAPPGRIGPTKPLQQHARANQSNKAWP